MMASWPQPPNSPSPLSSRSPPLQVTHPGAYTPGKAVGLAMFRIRVSHFASVAAAAVLFVCVCHRRTPANPPVVLNYL